MTETRAILTIINLHENPEYLEKCAELLNKQWPRSLSARIQSLEKSFSELPDSLLLIEELNGQKTVIGHSRITRVLEDNNGCWIGSVVISKENRNKGYGKYLMIQTEEYAKKLNFSTAYLNTQDQQGFYEHLGYIYGEAVSSVGFKSNGFTMKKIFDSPKRDSNTFMFASNQIEQSKASSNVFYDDNENVTPPIPPPPPPLVQRTFTNVPTLKSNLGQFWMKKTL